MCYTMNYLYTKSQVEVRETAPSKCDAFQSRLDQLAQTRSMCPASVDRGRLYTELPLRETGKPHTDRPL